MSDKTAEIPMAAFLNAMIVQEVRSCQDIGQAIARVENQHGMPPGTLSLENSAHLASLLYCLIVVPVELWARNGALQNALATLNTSETLSLFTISPAPPSNYQLFWLMGELRNSISNVRYDISSDDVITFWCQKDNMAPVTFHATIRLAQLMIFISTIGPVVANLRGS